MKPPQPKLLGSIKKKSTTAMTKGGSKITAFGNGTGFSKTRSGVLPSGAKYKSTMTKMPGKSSMSSTVKQPGIFGKKSTRVKTSMPKISGPKI